MYSIAKSAEYIYVLTRKNAKDGNGMDKKTSSENRNSNVLSSKVNHGKNERLSEEMGYEKDKYLYNLINFFKY